MSEPRRWLDEGAPAPVRELLDSAALDEPTAQDLAKLSAKVGALFLLPLGVAGALIGGGGGAAGGAAGAGGAGGAGAGGAAGGASAAGAGAAAGHGAAAAGAGAGAGAAGAGAAAGAALLKTVVVATVSAVVAGGASFQAGRSYEQVQEEKRATAAAASRPAQPAPVAEPPKPEPEPPAAEAPPEEPTPAPAPVVARPPGKKKPAPAPPPAPPAPAPGVPSDAEVSLLQQAMEAAQHGHPEVALQALDAHAAQFPSGALAQEREVLAIEAQVKLGRLGEAQARAARFKQTWPTSTHLLRVESLVRP